MAEKTFLQRLAAWGRLLFNRPVRAAVYTIALAAVASLVGTGELPAWSVSLAAPMLLALLNLSPTDVTPPTPPPEVKPIPE